MINDEIQRERNRLEDEIENQIELLRTGQMQLDTMRHMDHSTDSLSASIKELIELSTKAGESLDRLNTTLEAILSRMKP